jgi:hypothetical protein
MKNLWQSLVSVLPIFFNSFTGYEKSAFEPPTKDRLGPAVDLETKVLEFLRTEEKTGPPLAIAVVFDATRRVCSANTSFLERGFSSCEDSMPINASSPGVSVGDQNALLNFPAIYMRNTTNPIASPKSLISRRYSEKVEGNENLNVGRDPNPMAVNSSWPFTSWPNLIALLKGVVRSPLRQLGTPLPIHWLQVDAETSFHATPVNDSMWLVCMLKTSDENRWHRRKISKLAEEEIQYFFNEFARHLQFSEMLNPAHVLEIRRQKMGSKSFPVDLGEKLLLQRRDFFRDDDNFIDLLQSLKEDLGLRSPRYKETRDASYRLGFRVKSPAKPRLHRDIKDNHFVFFLGSQLMNAF